MCCPSTGEFLSKRGWEPNLVLALSLCLCFGRSSVVKVSAGRKMLPQAASGDGGGSGGRCRADAGRAGTRFIYCLLWICLSCSVLDCNCASLKAASLLLKQCFKALTHFKHYFFFNKRRAKL